MKPILAIDPGINGGLAVSSCGLIHSESMPDGMADIVDGIRSLKVAMGIEVAYIEQVGNYMPGNSGPSAAKFARHCGHLEAALYALGIPAVFVLPAKWQKAIGGFPADKAERKKAIKESMARRYPHLTVTLKTADALGILTYAIQQEQK